MTASVVSQVCFVVALIAVVLVVVGGGWLVSRRRDRDLAQLERPVPYTGPERRADHTKYVRAGKIVRPRDKWDMPEVDA